MATGPTGGFSYIKSGKAVFDASSSLVAHSIRSNKVNTANLSTDQLHVLHQENITINGNFNVGNNATLLSNQTLDGSGIVFGNLLVGNVFATVGDLRVDQSLSVAGPITDISESVQVAGLSVHTIPTNLIVNSDGSANTLIAHGGISTTTLNVGNLTLDSAFVSGDASVEGILDSNGFRVDSSGNILTDGNIIVDRNARLQGLERVMGSKTVLSNHQVAENISIIQNKYIEQHLFIEKDLLMDDASGNVVTLNADSLKQLLMLL